MVGSVEELEGGTATRLDPLAGFHRRYALATGIPDGNRLADTGEPGERYRSAKKPD